MAEQKTKRYLELQLEELKETYGLSDEEKAANAKRKEQSGDEKDAEIASLYEDCYEYEKDLEGFQRELEIINANPLSEIATVLKTHFPGEERDYESELKTVTEAGWSQFIENQSHPKEQLEIIQNSSFETLCENLAAAFPQSEHDFEADIRSVLVKRWEMLIAIKKEHVDEEIREIKTAGLKPHYAKRIYKRYHGLK